MTQAALELGATPQLHFSRTGLGQLSKKKGENENGSNTGLPDFSIFNIPKHWKIYQIATKLPNAHKIYQMALLHSK
jgi:hypothetical protein